MARWDDERLQSLVPTKFTIKFLALMRFRFLASRNVFVPTSANFDYDKYVDAFSRIFSHHYSHVNDYITNEALTNC